jgi:hypothetical protein
LCLAERTKTVKKHVLLFYQLVFLKEEEASGCVPSSSTTNLSRAVFT